MMDDQTFLERLPAHLQELEEQGYTVVPDCMDRATTAEIRRFLDANIPMKPPGALRVVAGVNEIRHPIPGNLMPRPASNPRSLRLAKTLLRSDDLCIREQVAMILQGSSRKRTQQSRHVYFASFCDPSATWLVHFCRTRKYRDDFPDSLRLGLPPELRSLLDY